MTIPATMSQRPVLLWELEITLLAERASIPELLGLFDAPPALPPLPLHAPTENALRASPPSSCSSDGLEALEVNNRLGWIRIFLLPSLVKTRTSTLPLLSRLAPKTSPRAPFSSDRSRRPQTVTSSPDLGTRKLPADGRNAPPPCAAGIVLRAWAHSLSMRIDQSMSSWKGRPVAFMGRATAKPVDSGMARGMAAERLPVTRRALTR